MPASGFSTFFSSLGGRLLLQLLFWIGVALFLTQFFGHFTADYRYTFLFVSLLMPVAVGTTYLINWVLVPRYLLEHRYGRFISYFIFTLIISVWAELLVMFWAFAALADYRYSNMNPLTGDIFLLVAGLYLVVFLSTSLNLLRHWYQSQQRISSLRSQQLEAELKLREAELQLLRGQLHPHFLFNTLNNLYGLALEHSADMPDAILRLSSLLDVLLYRSHHSQVELGTELKLIEDYLALEKLRFEERLSVHWQLQGDPSAHTIAPFLLFPFVENAVKHGFSGNIAALRLEICLILEENTLLFTVINSLGDPLPAEKGEKGSGGIGLSNVKKRLALLYPQQHQLELIASDTYFTARLRLQLSPLPSHAHASH
jgi:sensor histidine kinase YesM